MYNEVIRLIEAGVAMDRQKVLGYAGLLADNLEKKGDIKFAERIRGIISNNRQAVASLDSLGSKPVDSESHLDIVDVTYPNVAIDDLVLDKSVRKVVEDFNAGYEKREELMRAGIKGFNTLLLYGPPGCGKTSVARLIASQMELPLVVARLDTLVSSLLGSTAKNIRRVFEYASRMKCVLLLDEFDAIAKMRDDRNELGELKRVVNGLLQEMDMFSEESVLIAATNHHEMLDPAVWRRFGVVYRLGEPDAETVSVLLKRFLNGSGDDEVYEKKNVTRLSRALVGCSHSGIETIVQNALKESVLSGKDKVGYCDLLKSAYIFLNHKFDDNGFIVFLLNNKVPTRTIFGKFDYPVRKVREISKSLRTEGKEVEDGT
jgi:SpoVK/Ycf46/Vps4 family AAA+-type ATPase